MTTPRTNENRNGLRFRNAALCAAFGALSAMSFIVSGENYQGISDPPASSASYLWCALALCFALLYHTVYGRRKLRPAPANGVFALIFGVVNAFGVWLYSYDSWAALKNPLTLGLVCLQAVGQSLPMLAGFTWLHDWMQKTFAALPAVEEAPAKARWYCRHPVLGSMAALLVCWSPFLIAFFPGSVCWDLGEMAAQYFGLRQINTWHPVFLTGLYGALLSFGRLFSSDNLGTALYMLLQTLALSYAFARTMELLRRWGLPRWFRLAALGFFGLTPLFGGYAQSICKDTFYTAFLLLFALNMRGLAAAATVQKVLCFILVGAAIIGAVAALIGGDAKNWQPIYDVSDPTIYGAASEGLKEVSHHSMFGGIMAILASAPFFLAGFETIPQGVEDAGGDITNVGKTVVLSVCLACVFYAILLFCFGYGWPWQEFAHMANPSASTMFLNLYPGAVGEVLYWLITLGAIAGLFTTWNGFFMASASLLMGMGRGCLVPKVFAKQNKNGIPVPGLIVCLVLSLIGPFLGAGLIQDITSFSAAAFVLSWTITSYSLIRLRKKEPNLERPYKIPGGIAMGAFSAIVTTVVFVLLFIPNNPVYMGKTASIMFVGWMVIGIILFLASGVQRRRISPEERAAAMFSHAKDA